MLSISCRYAAAGLLAVALSSTVRAAGYVDVDSFTAPTGASMLVYAPDWDALVFKNSASAVAVVDIPSRAVSTRLAHYQFTDITLSPSGRYVFAADYGGENIGYATPTNTHTVHRLDLSTLAWDERTAYIAGNVQAVSDTQVILKSLDQWVTFTNNAWGTGPALTILNSSAPPTPPAYWTEVFFGNFRYDFRTGRLIHGNSGLSSQQIQAFTLAGNDFVKVEGSGIMGSAQGYGGTTVLSTDGRSFYYGALQVDALDVAHNTRIFPEWIYAADSDVAFGNGTYYDAHTGLPLGTLPFATKIYALNPAGGDFWAFDAATNSVHHFYPNPITLSVSSLDFGAASVYTTAPSRSFTVTNDSANPVTIASLTASAGYSIVSSDCAVLAAHSTCNVTVGFTPQSTGAVPGTVTIDYGISVPATVSLTGVGEVSLVLHYYQAIFGRNPDPQGKAFWDAEAARLTALGADINEVWYVMANTFFNSPEYASYHRDDTQFITDLYETFYNRSPDLVGLAYWSDQVAHGMPREIVLSSFLFSPEFREFTTRIFGTRFVRPEVDMVMDLYRGALGRLPDDAGFDHYLGMLRTAQCQGPGAVYAAVNEASSQFLSSPEYAGRARTHAQYVGDLYNLFLRRGGDLAGVGYWIGQLDTGALGRESVRGQFLGSAEFSTRVNAVIAAGCLH